MSVASKNLFDLLGNDVDGDSDTPAAPVKTVDKTNTHTTKRNVEPQAPTKPPGADGAARRNGPGGSEGAFRDRNAGRDSNQRRGTEETPRGGPRGGRGARRDGGRGARHPRTQDDRHTKSAVTGVSDKQGAQSGATEGEAEQKDEQAAEEMAQTELKEAVAEDAQAEDAAPAEPEDKSVSYIDYLAQQAEKKLALGESLEIRKPNEGTKVDKKWASAKALSKDDDDFIAGSAGKAKRERERKTKQVVDIDQRYVEPERPAFGGGRGDRGDRGDRGGRGGPRGEGRGGRGRGEGRGDFRGGRGRGESRGGRGPRGEGRGGEARGEGRGEGRGGGRGASGAINTDDQSAFPSLGA